MAARHSQRTRGRHGEGYDSRPERYTQRPCCSKDPYVKENWIDATGRGNSDWFPTKTSTICSRHFTVNYFIIKKSGNRYLKPGAIPRENVVHVHSCSIPRPRSENRNKDEPVRQQAHFPRAPRFPTEREKMPIPTKRPSNFCDNTTWHKPKFIATVPMQKTPTKFKNLPDQDTTKYREELRSDLYTDSNEPETLISNEDMMSELKTNWKEGLSRFDAMKQELNDKQMEILDLYVKMTNTHQKLSALGQKSQLPPAEDLRLMNLANMSPDQLLQLCSDVGHPIEKYDGTADMQLLANGSLTIDMNKLYNMPSKLVATCDETLAKRKEIIDWFEALKSAERGISMHKLTNKINEFNLENDVLKSSLKDVKAEFLKDLNEVIDYFRRGVNETIALQGRTQEFTNEIASLNAQNGDLRKQLHAAEHMKSQSINKYKFEELEKELKDEKCKKIVMKDRLTRAEGQVKMGIEQTSQFKAALEQARSQTWTLEHTVQQLQEQNQKLQIDFDKELNKLTDSIRENTLHLEEIAEAREKLQSEKEDLEKRLLALTQNYNESLQNMKVELKVNVAKLVDAEQKFNEEKQERKNLEIKFEELCSQLLDSELRYKDLLQLLQEKETLLNTSQAEFDNIKVQFEVANVQIDDYKDRLLKQNDAIRELERNYQEKVDIENNLKSDLCNKEDYIAELEKEKFIFKQQIRESECKMESYEKQLSTLKTHLTELQQEFGEFESISELHEMVNQQRVKLQETTRLNTELAEELQKKEMELEQHLEHIAEQQRDIQQRDGMVKMLSEKDEEQSNITILLRKNLEMRTRADTDLSQQLSEKSSEIHSLITSVETRKQQISQLEKIILTLEEQLRKVNAQRRNDREKISLLEKTVSEFQAYQIENKCSIEPPVDNLDNLIKILEDELGTPFQLHTNNEGYINHTMSKKKYIDRNNNKGDKYDTYSYHEGKGKPLIYQADNEKMPTKLAMGNCIKKTYISLNDDQYKEDNLDRKRAITNIETQNWKVAQELGGNLYAAAPSPVKDCIPAFAGTQLKKDYLSKKLQFQDEKNHKMFKFAGHRL